MEKLLAVVIAAALSPVWTQQTKVNFDKLPVECYRLYDSDMRSLRDPDSTEVIYVDMDKDGKNEMLVWDGCAGSGGQNWHIMTSQGNNWRSQAEVFGDVITVPHADRNGILIRMACGWAKGLFEYYELHDNKVKKLLAFDIDYSKPIRKAPVKINIKYPAKQ